MRTHHEASSFSSSKRSRSPTSSAGTTQGHSGRSGFERILRSNDAMSDSQSVSSMNSILSSGGSTTWRSTVERTIFGASLDSSIGPSSHGSRLIRKKIFDSSHLSSLTSSTSRLNPLAYDFTPNITWPYWSTSSASGSCTFNPVPIPTTSWGEYSSMQWPRTWISTTAPIPSAPKWPNQDRNPRERMPNITWPYWSTSSASGSYTFNPVPIPTTSWGEHSSMQWPRTWISTTAPISSDPKWRNHYRNPRREHTQNRTFLTPAQLPNPKIVPPSTCNTTDYSQTDQRSRIKEIGTFNVAASHDNGRQTEKIKGIQTVVGVMQVLVGLGNLVVATTSSCTIM